MKLMALIHRLCIGLVLASLGACGFTLKGAPQALSFSHLQLQTQANSYLAPDVRLALTQRGIKLSTDANAPLPRLALTDEVRSRSVLSTNVNGRLREFQLKHSVTVQLWDGQGREWLPPVTYALSRDLSYDENKVLAKEAEELALFKEMQAELLGTVLRRLEASRTTMPLSQ